MLCDLYGEENPRQIEDYDGTGRVILEAVQLQPVHRQPLAAFPADGQIHGGNAVPGNAQPLVLLVRRLSSPFPPEPEIGQAML